MSGTTLGFVKYILGFDSVSFRKGMTEADRDLVKLQKKFQSVGEGMKGLGAKLTLGLTAPLAGFAAAGIKEAQETAAAMAQVNAALGSMGPVAGKTAAELERAAGAFEGASLFEADQILKDVTANLLTFGNIGGKAFDGAQQAAIDLSTRLGTDLKSSAILVGKALNDPVKGLTALGRAGVQFTDAQKEAIKAMVAGGDAAGAQGIILGELKKQFGGAAAAAQNADPFNKLTDAFKGMAESIGPILIPMLTKVAEFLAGLSAKFQALTPQTRDWIVTIGTVVAVAGPVLAILGSLVGVLGTSAKAVGALGTAWKAYQASAIAARFASVGLLPALGPILIPLGAIAVAVGAVYVAFKNWDRITGFVRDLYNGVKTWLMDKLGAVLKWVGDKVRAVGGAFKWLLDDTVTHSTIPDLVLGVGAWMAKLPDLMHKPAAEGAARVASEFSALGDKLGGAAIAVPAVEGETEDGATPPPAATQVNPAGGLSDRLRSLSEALRNLGGEGRKSFANIAGSILDAAIPAIEVMADKTATLQDKLTALGKSMADIFGGIIGGKWGRVIGAVLQAGVTFAGKMGGARANGGPVVPGKTYLVGENGPEWVTPRRKGFVHPNGSGGQQRIMIVPSPHYEAIIDRRSSNVAAPMVAQGAVMSVAGAEARSFRRARRSIP